MSCGSHGTVSAPVLAVAVAVALALESVLEPVLAPVLGSVPVVGPVLAPVVGAAVPQSIASGRTIVALRVRGPGPAREQEAEHTAEHTGEDMGETGDGAEHAPRLPCPPGELLRCPRDPPLQVHALAARPAPRAVPRGLRRGPDGPATAAAAEGV